MATVTLSRSDLFPVSTTVGIYPAGAGRRGRPGPPTAAEIAHADVDAAGALSVTDAGIVANTQYVAYALVNSEHRYCECRSTLDKFDTGGAVGTGDTTSGSAAVANASASSGTFRVGQIITGPGIPGLTRIHDISGATLNLTAAATATGTGVALVAYEAFDWQAVLMQRRAALGTA